MMRKGKLGIRTSSKFQRENSIVYGLNGYHTLIVVHFSGPPPPPIICFRGLQYVAPAPPSKTVATSEESTAPMYVPKPGQKFLRLLFYFIFSFKVIVIVMNCVCVL